MLHVVYDKLVLKFKRLTTEIVAFLKVTVL
jgi:hypothetical protein